MGGRGARLSIKSDIQDKLKVNLAKSENRTHQETGKFLFDRKKELSSFDDKSYRKANTPRGANTPYA